jgi:hypothetical protein
MSCWVVPTLAADLWGVPVEHVLRQIDAGDVPSQTVLGFVLVDVAPDSEVFRPSRRKGPPPTYTVISTSDSSDSADPSADEFARQADDAAAVAVLTAPEEWALAGGDGGDAFGRTDDGSTDDAADETDAEEEEDDRGPCDEDQSAEPHVPMNWARTRSRIAATRRGPGRPG